MSASFWQSTGEKYLKGQKTCLKHNFTFCAIKLQSTSLCDHLLRNDHFQNIIITLNYNKNVFPSLTSARDCGGRFFLSKRTGTLRAILYFNVKRLRQFLRRINSKESSLARKGRHSLEVPRSSRTLMAELTATTSPTFGPNSSLFLKVELGSVRPTVKVVIM